ncbi:MAG: CAP domain-containing protein [Pseudomonadota bacterium]
MLDLINGERAAEGLAPLRFNGDLNESSEDHSDWMLENNVFSHTGIGGSTSTDRMRDAGYPLEGSWATRENIAYVPEGGEEGLSDEVIQLHQNLMNSPGHRANILNPGVTDIGIGIEEGLFTDDDGDTFNTVMVTQNFARTSAETEPLTLEPQPIPDVEVPSPTMDEMLAAVPGIQTPPRTQNTQPASTTQEEDITMTPTTKTFTFENSSSGSATATADTEDGPSVEVEGEGDFTARGSATVGDETVTEEATGGDLADGPAPRDAFEERREARLEELRERRAERLEELRAGRDDDTADEDGSTVTTGSVTNSSSASVTATGDAEDGPSVEIEGEGNFAGSGTATVGDETVTETVGELADDFPEPDEIPEGANVTTGTVTNSSSGSVTATADAEDGPNVEIEGEGNFAGSGTATVGDETVTETEGDGFVFNERLTELLESRLRDEDEVLLVESMMGDAASAPAVQVFTTPGFDAVQFDQIEIMLSNFGIEDMVM